MIEHPASETPPEPAPFTANHPRCLEVARKLHRAKLAMQARGTPLLLGNRPAWVRVSSPLTLVRRA